jgi:hypothetical protein
MAVAIDLDAESILFDPRTHTGEETIVRSSSPSRPGGESATLNQLPAGLMLHHGETHAFEWHWTSSETHHVEGSCW